MFTAKPYIGPGREYHGRLARLPLAEARQRAPALLRLIPGP